jgi:hypothetical protein
VPTWPISDSTISSLLPRSFDPVFMKVRFTCMSKRRVPKNGIAGPSTYASSTISPVLISFTASSTRCGFIRLPEPRSSVAPHFEGQRALSGGTVQDGVCALAVAAVSTSASAPPNVAAFICRLPKRVLEAAP